MHLNPFSLIALGIGFTAAAFLGVQYGAADGDGSTLASSLATTIGLAIFFGVFFLIERLLDGVAVKRRSEQFDSAKEQERIRRSERYRQRLDQIYDRRRSLFDVVVEAVQKLFKIEGSRLQELRLELVAAGFYRESALATYLFLIAAMPVTLLILAGSLGVLQAADGKQVLFRMIMGALIGFLMVKLYVSRRVKARREIMRLEMPDVIDLLVIYTESGVALDSALKRVVDMMRRRFQVAPSEMALLERELLVLPDRARAFENLIKRMDVPIVKNFASILLQSERVGSPISAALRQLSAETRRERLLNAEQRAARIPVLIQLPILAFILPALIIIVLGPTAVRIMDAFTKL